MDPGWCISEGRQQHQHRGCRVWGFLALAMNCHACNWPSRCPAAAIGAVNQFLQRHSGTQRPEARSTQRRGADRARQAPISSQFANRNLLSQPFHQIQTTLASPRREHPQVGVVVRSGACLRCLGCSRQSTRNCKFDNRGQSSRPSSDAGLVVHPLLSRSSFSFACRSFSGREALVRRGTGQRTLQGPQRGFEQLAPQGWGPNS